MNEETKRQFKETQNILDNVNNDLALEYITWTNSPICTILPLTSVRLNDKKWYHIDLEQKNSTAMIEQVRNISKLRILSPKRTRGLINRITTNDLYNINKALKNYYKLQLFPNKK